MGFWPDWWPANPIGSAWDSFGNWWHDWQYLVYAIIIAIVAVVILFIYLKLRR